MLSDIGHFEELAFHREWDHCKYSLSCAATGSFHYFSTTFLGLPPRLPFVLDAAFLALLFD